MTLEEKLKVCSVCKNRKHSIKEGLVCGKTGTKPAFADECPDFDIDIAEQERLKKNTAELAEADHRRSGAFGFYIGINRICTEIDKEKCKHEFNRKYILQCELRIGKEIHKE